MPASDTLPCSVAIESFVSMNSAGSCDSMFSTNSAFSDDSMEHLSAEERACLMFLEETIESLEAEDDSGVSNDEPEQLNCNQTSQEMHLHPAHQTKSGDMSFHDELNKVLGKDDKCHSLPVPTPQVLANGSFKMPQKFVEVSTPDQKVVNDLSVGAPNSHHQPTGDPTQFSTPGTTGQSVELADLPPSFIPEPPVKVDSSDSKTRHNPPQLTQLEPKLDQKHKSVASDMLMELIPPPSDFMDEPTLTAPAPAKPPDQNQVQAQITVQTQDQLKAEPQTQPQTQSQLKAESQSQLQPQTQCQAKAEPQCQAKAEPQGQAKAEPQGQAKAEPQAQPQIAQGQLQSQAQHKEQTQHQLQPPHLLAQPHSESLTIAPPPGFGTQIEDEKPQIPVTPSSRGPLSPSELERFRKKASLKKAPGIVPVAVVRPSSQVSDQPSNSSSGPDSLSNSPPTVAPKPKKLPSNIVIKSHKDSGPGHPIVSQGDRMMNPQKVHIEALKKLGLLKVDETDTTPSLSSNPPNRILPPAPFNTSTFAAPSTGDATQIPATEQRVAAQDVPLPAPTNSEKGESPIIPRGQSPKLFEIKSASMDHPRGKSDLADHSFLIMGQEKSLENSQEKTKVELSPGQLRKSQTRPASVGSQKDFGIDQLPFLPSREKDLRRSQGSSPIHSVQASTDSQKAPRSNGMISVMFTPLSKNEENRRQALRKLGLIKD